jgi:hypothetical protein
LNPVAADVSPRILSRVRISADSRQRVQFKGVFRFAFRTPRSALIFHLIFVIRFARRFRFVFMKAGHWTWRADNLFQDRATHPGE